MRKSPMKGSKLLFVTKHNMYGIMQRFCGISTNMRIYDNFVMRETQKEIANVDNLREIQMQFISDNPNVIKKDTLVSASYRRVFPFAKHPQTGHNFSSFHLGVIFDFSTTPMTGKLFASSSKGVILSICLLNCTSTFGSLFQTRNFVSVSRQAFINEIAT